MSLYYIHKFVRKNFIANSVYVADTNFIYTYDANSRLYSTDRVVQASNSGSLPEVANLPELLKGSLDSPLENTNNIMLLDSSIQSGELLPLLGDYNGDDYVDISSSESPEFVGWSTSNTYTLSPASSSTTVQVLTNLTFSDLQKHDVEIEVASPTSNLEDELPLLSSFTSEDDGKVYLVRRQSNAYSYILRSVSWDSNSSSASYVNLDSNDPYNKVYSSLKYVADSVFYDSVEPTTNQERENKLVRKALTSLPEPFLSGLKLEGEIQLYNPTEDTTLTLNTIDANDVVWVVTDVDGWWTLPEPEVPDLPRGWGDGSYDAVGRWANRILNLTGAFLPQGPEDAFRARSTLIDILSPMVKTQGAGYLLVQEDDLDNPGQKITKAAKVRLSGPPLITSTNPRGRHDFSIGLKAVDPIKYEFVSGDPDGYTTETIDSSSSWEATIVNKGNVAVPIIIEISGISSVANPDNPPTITNDANDQSIQLVDGVASGHKLEIDTYNREVLDVTYTSGAVTNVANGRAKLPVLVDWIYLEPGSNRLYVDYEVPGSEWVIYYRSGWIG